MWWLLTALAVVGAGFLAVTSGFIPPPHAKTLIRIQHGQLKVTRGKVRAQPREFVSDMLQQAGVQGGYIAITPGKHVAFSRKIPRSLHQRLRNVLLND